MAASTSARAPVASITSPQLEDLGSATGRGAPKRVLEEPGRRPRWRRRRPGWRAGWACPPGGRRRPACRSRPDRRTRRAGRRAAGRPRRAAGRTRTADRPARSARSGAARAAPRWSGRSTVYLAVLYRQIRRARPPPRVAAAPASPPSEGLVRIPWAAPRMSRYWPTLTSRRDLVEHGDRGRRGARRAGGRCRPAPGRRAGWPPRRRTGCRRPARRRPGGARAYCTCTVSVPWRRPDPSITSSWMSAAACSSLQGGARRRSPPVRRDRRRRRRRTSSRTPAGAVCPRPAAPTAASSAGGAARGRPPAHRSISASSRSSSRRSTRGASSASDSGDAPVPGRGSRLSGCAASSVFGPRRWRLSGRASGRA